MTQGPRGLGRQALFNMAPKDIKLYCQKSTTAEIRASIIRPGTPDPSQALWPIVRSFLSISCRFQHALPFGMCQRLTKAKLLQ